jgi:hypothetical protein
MGTKTLSSLSWAIFKASSDLNWSCILNVRLFDDSLEHFTLSMGCAASVNDQFFEVVAGSTLITLAYLTVEANRQLVYAFAFFLGH